MWDKQGETSEEWMDVGRDENAKQRFFWCVFMEMKIHSESDEGWSDLQELENRNQVW